MVRDEALKDHSRKILRSVVDQLLTREQRFVEAEVAQIANAHRIQDAEQMIDFVLHDSRMEAADRAVDCFSELIETAVAQTRVTGPEPAQSGN